MKIQQRIGTAAEIDYKYVIEQFHSCKEHGRDCYSVTCSYQTVKGFQ